MSTTAAEPVVAYRLFKPFPELICRTTTRLLPPGDDGPAPFNLGVHTGPNRTRAAERRRRLCEEHGLAFAGLTTSEQVHGNRVAVIGRAERGRGRLERADALPDADGLATDLFDTPLLVFSADCCPIVLFDPVRRAIAAVHAGRKGTAGGIAAVAVRTMAERFGSRAADIRAVIGPSIGPCCYEVGEEIPAEFPGRSELFERRAGRLFLDLWSANRGQLLAAGLPPKHVEFSGLCTACRTDVFFSYRKEGTGCGMMGTMVGMRRPTR
jgi:hypothetical protein